MTKASYERNIQAQGAIKSDTGTVDFPGLKSKDGSARIAVTIGYGFEFGTGKCSVTVSVACDQNEATIDQAADMAMRKADQLAAEGMRLVEERLRDG